MTWSRRAIRKLRRMRSSLRFILKHPLARRNRTAAVWRYFWFHIAGCFLPGPAVYPWFGGLRFLAKPGMSSVAGCIYTGLSDFEEMAFLLHFLRKDDLFVDVGANVGTYTLLASGICGATTIAIEPIPDTFRMLLANVALNGLGDRVRAYQVGAGAKHDILRFRMDLDSMNRVALPQDPPECLTEVPVVPLTDLLGYQEPAMMKIDVEGYEPEVLEGAARVLPAPGLNAVVIEVYGGYAGRYGHSLSDSIEILTTNGFAPYAYDPWRRRLSPEGVDSTAGGFNRLFVRQPNVVEKRLQNAPAVTILGVRV